MNGPEMSAKSRDYITQQEHQHTALKEEQGEKPDDELSETKEKNDEYRSKIMRFTFQLSLAMEKSGGLNSSPKRARSLKDNILRDKAQTAWVQGTKAQNPTKPVATRSYSPFVWVGRVLLMGFNPKGRNLYDLLSAVQFSRRSNVSRSTCL